MTIIVVGGHARKTGKTSVAAGLIRALPDYSWTGIKISTHWHDSSAMNRSLDICEETVRDGNSDSSRFLTAGAERAFWVRVKEDKTEELIPGISPLLQATQFIMVESNRLVRHLRPNLYIMVLNCDVEDFKESARATIAQADVLLAVNWTLTWKGWKHVPAEVQSSTPLFHTRDPAIIPVGLVDLVKTRLP